ncbi:serine-rich coiled-coil domain-containing protein 2 isoform X2 [Genypterus blacodes]|uniref:serine-rich coiled-coil domain-containing protein 2 isoform X2 n=1 Tax=Genypterus blacodes TaxID=154954 RepID=UPI003F75BBE9
MEEKSSIRSAMVSRLPKFGGRSSASGSVPLSNGSSQSTTPTQDGKTTPPGTRTNGVICTSPFSLKWKKDEGTNPSCPTTITCTGDRSSEDKAQTQTQTQTQNSSLGKELKNSSPVTPKMRRSGCLMVAVSSPKAIPKYPSKMSPKLGTKLGLSPLHGGPKVDQNGSSRMGLPAGPEPDSCLARSKLRSLRSSSQDSLSHSEDNLQTLTQDNMVRSNSFTHFKQIPSPTSQPMTRSFSFNRAVELAKPLANTQLQPPRSSFLKPPQMSNGRVGLGLGTLNGFLGGAGLSRGLKSSRSPPATSSLPNPSTLPVPTGGTPNALRKPLLPSCVLNKTLGSSGGSLGYRLPRPGQAKQQKPLLPPLVKRDVRPTEEVKDTEPTGEAEKAESHTDSDTSSGGEGRGRGGDEQCARQAAGETVDEMSFSSASSLDRGDTSEEYLDDFERVGDALSDGFLLDIKEQDSAQKHLRSFLRETMEWGPVGLAGHTEEMALQESRVPLVLSPEGSDVPQGSSLELSPSNSSGGTYMWDEEGLEPLGGLGTHLCDSYDDSDLNSMDILNNLEPLESGELEDDDLMLDVDLPEDGLHDADRMSHLERLDRGSRQGQRRKQHRWSGPDHFHNDSRVPVFQHYDGFRAPRISSGPASCEVRREGSMDDLALKHMAQDCSAFKNQLLRLKTLLQLEDTGSAADVAEGSEDNTTALQLEELMKEVQALREELRGRDKTIAQLTLQCQQLQQRQQQQQQQEQTPTQGRQGRCQCDHQRAPSSSARQSDRQMDRRTARHYDKATQTYWRAPAHTGVLPTPPLSPWQAQHQGLTRTSMPQRRQTSSTTAFQTLPQRAPLPAKTSKTSPHRGPQ